MFSVASASAIFTALLGNISTMLGTVLTAVFLIFGALLCVGIAVHYTRKYIASRKG